MNGRGTEYDFPNIKIIGVRFGVGVGVGVGVFLSFMLCYWPDKMETLFIVGDSC